MPKAGKSRKPKQPPQTLKGWKAIGEYLGVGAASAQHWAKTGMPVRKEGRFIVADVEGLRSWLGEQAHMPAPAHVVTDTGDDISAALKESISALRRHKAALPLSRASKTG
jgi:hypothetical protein